MMKNNSSSSSSTVDLKKNNSMLFQKTHQLQKTLLESPTKQTIQQYHDHLAEEILKNKINVEDNQQENKKLQEFLLFPLLSLIRKQINNDTTPTINSELTLDTISLILKHLKLTDVHLFDEILTLVSMLLSKKQFEKQQISEEFYSSCLNLLFGILLNVDRVDIILLLTFYQFKSLTTIGLLINVLLFLLTWTTSVQLREHSLKCLSQLIAPGESLALGQRSSILFASFLPGISIKLIQDFLLTQNLKCLNHKVICACLHSLQLLMCSVMNDTLLDEENFKSCFVKCGISNNDKIKDLIVNRLENKEWHLKAAANLSTLLKRLLNALITNQDENDHIQISLIEFCTQLRNHCSVSLCDLMPICFDVLVLYYSDSNNKVEANVLNSNSMMNNSVEQILQKLIMMTLDHDDRDTSIPSNNLIDSDLIRIKELKMLNGYLRLIGSQQNNLKSFLFSNLSNLTQLLRALISCVTLDFKSLNNFYSIKEEEELSTVEAHELSNYSGLKTYLSVNARGSIFKQLSAICEYLGSSLSRLIVDELLTNSGLYWQREEQNTAECMFILVLLLNGMSSSSTIDKDKEGEEANTGSIVQSVIVTFIERIQLNELKKKKNFDKNREILEKCLMLELISSASGCLSKSHNNSSIRDKNLFLIETLFFTLEHYKSDNLLIRAVATRSLTQLALNLDYIDVQHLLSHNYTHIMNELVIRTFKEQKKRNSSVTVLDDDNKNNSHLLILCSLLSISNKEIVPYLKRICDDYHLATQLRPQDHSSISEMLSLMLHMSRAMRRWYPLEFNKNILISDDEKDEIISSIDLQKWKKQQKIEEGQSLLENLLKIEMKIEEDKTETVEEKEKEEEEENKKIELHIELQSKCLELCVSLISHPLRSVRLQTMQLVRELAQNLLNETNVLLPLMHRLWSPLCQRFSLDTEHLVRCRIVSLIFELSVFCSDFLAARFTREFLPRLAQFMFQQSKQSKQDHNSTYSYSHAFKLQCAILSNIDKLAVLFRIREMSLETLILEQCVLPYLDSSQPKKLQELAVIALRNCAISDPNCVWMNLHFIMPFENGDCYSKQLKLKYKLEFRDEIREDLIRLFNEI